MHHKSFSFKAGVRVHHTFPEGFSAYWVRATANETCKATVAFVYE